jgi:hypothetical protein
MYRLIRRVYDAYRGRVPINKIGTVIRVGDGLYVVTQISIRRGVYEVGQIQFDAISLSAYKEMRNVRA